MTGTNHALTGGLIAMYLPLPVALPLAFASHFALDVLPHYGIPHSKRNSSRVWKVIFISDFFITFSLAAAQVSYHHYAIFLGGLFAVMADFVWVTRVLHKKSFDLSSHNHWFSKFHAEIQLFERPWGIFLEIPLAAVLFYLVFLKH